MAYILDMEFIETKNFTKRVTEILTDEEYREFQAYLIEHPDAGDIIQGTGGIRKVRFGSSDKGKRGGSRIIYFWKTESNKIYLLTIYAKSQKVDLTEKQKQLLAQVIREIK